MWRRRILKGVVGLRIGVAVSVMAPAFVWTRVGESPALWMIWPAATPVPTALICSGWLRGSGGHGVQCQQAQLSLSSCACFFICVASSATPVARSVVRPAMPLLNLQRGPPSKRRFFQSSRGLKMPAGVMMPVMSSGGVTSKPGLNAWLVGFATRT